MICHVENPQLQIIYGSLDDTKDMNVLSYSVGILQDIRFAMDEGQAVTGTLAETVQGPGRNEH